MKLLDSIRERIVRAGVRRAKMLLRNSTTAYYSNAHSVESGMRGVRAAIRSTMPLDLTSKAKVDKANEALKTLKAKDAYKNQ